jgi:glycosyltransferase involved in cell wall biosynthesis
VHDPDHIRPTGIASDRGIAVATGVSARPLVSVGMPVYNEVRFIAAAIGSLLEQTYSNLELIISDNGSTDGTGEISESFALRDGRVRYVRNPRNIGATQNFANAQALATGKYFMWAGGHDLWDPDLVEKSVQALESHPDAVVATASCRWIDGAGAPLARESGWTDTRGMSSVERFFTIMWGNMHPILGLMRLDALRQTSGVRAGMGADLLLLSELALLGHFLHVPTTAWCRREIRPDESYEAMLRRHRSDEYGLVRRGVASRCPTLALGARLVATAWRAPLSAWHRILICAGVLGTLPARYVGARLRRA